MWAHRGIIALSLVAVASGGCAAHKPSGFSDRFVKSGTPSVDLGGPRLDSKATGETSGKKEPPPALRAASFGTSIESTDPRLAAALLAETTVPTPDTHLRAALEYERLGILDASANHLQLALDEQPHFPPAHEEFARLWRDWGLPDRGLPYAYRAIYYAPQSASAQNTLGTILSALGRFDLAREAYRHAVALDSSASWALNNLCDLERRFGYLEEAQRDCQAALGIEPGFAAAHNNLALVLAAAGDLDAARREFLAAGDVASADYNLGLLHMADGNYVAAAASFEAAIKERPDFVAAKERAHAARLQLLTGGK